MDRVKLTGVEQREVIELANRIGDKRAADIAKNGQLKTRAEGMRVLEVINTAEAEGMTNVPYVTSSFSGTKDEIYHVYNLRDRIENAMGRSPYGL